MLSLGNDLHASDQICKINNKFIKNKIWPTHLIVAKLKIQIYKAFDKTAFFTFLLPFFIIILQQPSFSHANYT